MKVKELATELAALIDEGHGEADLIIEEVGEGYFGPLLNVDTVLIGINGAPTTVTLLGEAMESRENRF